MPYSGSGAAWIDPQGQAHEVKDHAPFARDIIRTQMIGDAQQQKVQPTLSGEGDETRLDQKGMSGEHAAAYVDEQLGDPSQQHSNMLLDQGWVQVRDGNFYMSTEDAARVALPWIRKVVQETGKASANGSPVSMEMVDAAESGAANLLQGFGQKGSKDDDGTGFWSGASKNKRIRYFR